MDRSLFCCCNLLFIIIIGLFSLLVWKQFDKINNSGYELTQCNITRVSYPTSILNRSEDLWQDCYCGRRCRSFSPCIRLYTDIGDGYIKGSYPEEEDAKCTFVEDKCYNGEGHDSITMRIMESISKAELYLNSTIDCYYKDDASPVYLEIEMNLQKVIFAIFVIIISFCICLLCNAILYNMSKKNIIYVENNDDEEDNKKKKKKGIKNKKENNCHELITINPYFEEEKHIEIQYI